VFSANSYTVTEVSSTVRRLSSLIKYYTTVTIVLLVIASNW